MKHFINLILALSLSLNFVKAQDKSVILKAEDLPKHSYELENKDAVAIVKNKGNILELAAMVKKDLLADLEKYDIKENATQREYYGNLRFISIIEGDYKKALEYIQKERELADKESDKITLGISSEAFINAAVQNKTLDANILNPKITECLEKKLNDVDFAVIQEDIEAAKGQTEIMSENLLVSVAKSQIQPALNNNKGEVPGDLIQGLINIYYILNYYIPYKEALYEAYANVLNENVQNVEIYDIWKEREVTLKEDAKYSPVIIGIWDTGVDESVLPQKNQWINVKEKFDSKDSDGNSFVDDVYGIAYNLEGYKNPNYLEPLANNLKDKEVYQGHLKGLMDLQANVNSKEVSGLKKYLAQLKSDDINDFFDNLTLYSYYAHGTHVAGIAAAGNPYAKILSARLTFDYRSLPKSPTKEVAENWAKMFMETVAYFKANNVRVVNMSWTVDYNYEFMRIFELNGTGKDDEERKQMAKEYFEIEKEGFLKGIQSAPEILFVCAAGNENNNSDFMGAFPSSLNLPNLLTVGAVDIEGLKTSFTTEGESVDVFANGYEVNSYVPGGDIMALSGTSMASPQVVNLAGKILAVNPKLKPEHVIDIILKASTISAEDEKVLLIHPKKSIELVSK